jgi:YggT family protein
MLRLLITLYIWIVIARVVLSWLNVESNNPVVQFIIKVTDPVLTPIRRVVPDLGGLDISPLILIIGLYLLRNLF